MINNKINAKDIENEKAKMLKEEEMQLCRENNLKF